MGPRLLVLVAIVAACTGKQGRTTPQTIKVPTPSVQVGACGEPGRDGVVSAQPRIERADRDLDGDGRKEIIVVDRAKCTAEGNCYWNIFRQSTDPSECARYAGTFAGASLELLPAKGDENMSDVRAYWAQSGGRMLLQSYRFARDGYWMADVIQCKRAADDRLECADTNN